MSKHAVMLASLALTLSMPAAAQWTNRYQKMTGFAHHVYVEGYEFPTVAAGPTYPAVSPDGRRIAFSARGWIWVMSLEDRVARRLTTGGGMDTRPAWSPDGAHLAFVRDNTRDTDIVEIDVRTGAEVPLADSPAPELDPAYSPDGAFLYYSSSQAGDLDIWRLDRGAGEATPVTTEKGQEVRPQPLADGSLVFVAKVSGADTIVVRQADGQTRAVYTDSIASQMRPAVSLDGRRVAASIPRGQWTLQVIELDGSASTSLVAEEPASSAAPVSGGFGHPVMPAWAPDGTSVYFARAGRDASFELWRVPASGGPPELASPSQWDWGEPTGRVIVRTRLKGRPDTIPARLHVSDARGHAAMSAGHQAWFDGQNGLIFSYSPGTLEFEVPAGPVRVVAAHGFEHAAARGAGRAGPDRPLILDLEMPPVGGPSLEGWYSGDHHFHVNYGGPARLEPEALVPMMQGEDLDVATPLVANLHTRTSDEEWFGWSRREPPLIWVGQEIRPHFLGHTGHIGVSSLYTPWYWGPGYSASALDDRSNAQPLAHTRREGGVATYVHPVTPRTPFVEGEPPRGLPLELVSDAVLGDVDTLEVACLWSDELGTSEAWYRLLNVGVALAPSAGTDVMTDFFRTMAVGTARVYVQVGDGVTFDRYFAALKAGRSFVTTGPLLQFRVGEAGPGGIVSSAPGDSVPWVLNIASAVAFERVEVLVNGVVAWTTHGQAAAGASVHKGEVAVPAGGWIAARVHGGLTEWPAMESYPFAHTAPIWFGSVGSRDPQAAGRAARELLAALDVSEQRLKQAYGESPAPNLLARIAQAREKLQAFVRLEPPRD